jgi:hypothetical protein
MLSSSDRQKNLSSWLELDAHNRPRGLKLWRRRLTWWTLGVTALVVFGAFFVPRASKLAQAAPVTPPHAHFNDDCARCHTEPLTTAERFLPWKAHVKAVPNSACSDCHKDVGDHHPAQSAGGPQACARCHREHQGKRLTEVGNEFCVDCHKNLKAHHTSPENCGLQDVEGFPKGHPATALWRGSDPRFPGSRDELSKLHFNHKVHVRDKGVLTRRDAVSRQRLAEKGAVLLDDGLSARLDCTFCHAADSAGRYMQPVTYERNCADCHPLWVRVEEQQFRNADPRLLDLVRQFNREPAPHRRPMEVRNALAGRLIDLIQEKPLRRTPEEPPPRGPLRVLDDPVAQKRWELVKPEEKKAEDVLFVRDQGRRAEQWQFDGPAGCAYCHVEQTREKDSGLPVYGPSSWRLRPDHPPPPERWFPKARFDHKSHTFVSCGQCHGAAASEKTSDLLLPTIETCAECHNQKVGVRSDCIGCHQYHPRGSPTSQPPRTINEYLRK